MYVAIFQIAGNRFQTTYEELKPDMALGDMHIGPSFQTTYEELKL